MPSSEFKVQIILEALDLATKNIQGVNDKVQELKNALTTSEFTAAASGMERFGQAVETSTQPMADAAKTALSLGAAISAVAGALAGRVYQSAVEYESATSDLAKVMDGGAESAATYGQQLNALASQYGQNGQALLASMTNFVQAGYNADEAFKLVDESVKLMIAGELDASESSANLVSILKGFDAPASDAAHAVDLLNAVSNTYATDVKQLSEGMAALSPIARQMGFSMDETAGLLTPVIEVFRSGNEAADALKTGLQRLTDDSKPVTDALSAIGVAQHDANGQLRSGKDIFLDVATAFDSLDDAQKQYLTQQLVGIDQAGRMSTVLGKMANYLQISGVATNSAGSAMREVEVRLKTAEVQARRAEESFRQLSVTLGNQFKPEITGVISATGDLANAFDSATQAGDLEPLIAALRPQIAAVENLIRAMAGNLEAALEGVDWKPLVDGLKSVSSEFGEAFATLTEGVDLTTVEGLRTALNGVVMILGKLAQWVSGVIDGLGPLMGALNTLFGVVSSGYPEFAKLVGQLEGLSLSANKIIPVIASISSVIFGTIGAIAEFVFKITLAVSALRLLQAAGLPIASIFSGIGSAMSALGPTILSFVGRLTGLTVILKGILEIGTFVVFEKIGTAMREAALAAEDFRNPLYLVKKELEGVDWILSQLSDSYRLQLESERNLQSTQERTAQVLKQISDQTGVTVTSMKELDAAVKEGKLAWDATANTWIVAAEKAKDFTAANRQMIEASDQQLAVADALRQQFAALELVYDSTTGKIRRQGEATKELNISAERQLSLLENESKNLDAQNQISLDRLRLQQSELQQRGLWRSAATMDLSIRQAEVAASKVALEAKLAEIDVAKDVLAAKKAEATTIGGEVLPAKQAEIDAAQQSVTAKQLEADAIRNKIALQQQEAVAAADASQQARYHREVEAAQTLRARQAQEAYAEAEAKAAEEAQGWIDASQGAASAAKWMADMLSEAKGELGQYSSEAVTALNAVLSGVDTLRDNIRQIEALNGADFVNVDSLTQAKSDLESLTEALAATNEKVRELERAGADASNIFAGMDRELAAVKRFQAEVLQAKIAQEKLAIATQEMEDKLAALSDQYDRGDLSLSEYITKLQRMESTYARLGDERLDGLRDALRQAKEEMDSFTESAQDGLAALQVQWAELNDQQDEVLRLQHQQDQIELEKKLAEARAQGNRAAIDALQQQLDLLDRIYRKKQDNLKTDQASTTAESATATKPATTIVQSGPSAFSGKTVKITLGRAEVYGTQSSADALIDELKRAGMRAI